MEMRILQKLLRHHTDSLKGEKRHVWTGGIIGQNLTDTGTTSNTCDANRHLKNTLDTHSTRSESQATFVDPCLLNI